MKAIEDAVNQKLLAVCKEMYPDIEFRLANGEVSLISEDPIVSLVDSGVSEQNVSSYYRRNKKTGEIKRVKGHSKKQSMPSALELAVAQEQQEENPLGGIDMDKLMEEFLKQLSKQDSIGTLKV